MMDKTFQAAQKSENVCFRLVQDMYMEHKWIRLGGLGVWCWWTWVVYLTIHQAVYQTPYTKALI